MGKLQVEVYTSKRCTNRLQSGRHPIEDIWNCLKKLNQQDRENKLTPCKVRDQVGIQGKTDN